MPEPLTPEILKQLIDWVERAEGLDRETDCLIAAAIGYVGVESKGQIVCWHDPRGVPVDDIPVFTAERDATAALLRALLAKIEGGENAA